MAFRFSKEHVMRRYAITLGASTDSGGKVTSASSRMSIAGALIALEGDSVFCPACKSEGKIVCDGPRLPEAWMGRQIALQDDMCVCACLKPPRLIASQTLKCQIIGSDAPAVTLGSEVQLHAASARSALAPEVFSTDAPKADHDFDECFRLTEPDGSTPLSGRRYRIIAASGQTWEGRTDADGLTLRVTTPDMTDLTLEILPD